MPGGGADESARTGPSTREAALRAALGRQPEQRIIDGIAAYCVAHSRNLPAGAVLGLLPRLWRSWADAPPPGPPHEWHAPTWQSALHEVRRATFDAVLRPIDLAPGAKRFSSEARAVAALLLDHEVEQATRTATLGALRAGLTPRDREAFWRFHVDAGAAAVAEVRARRIGAELIQKRNGVLGPPLGYRLARVYSVIRPFFDGPARLTDDEVQALTGPDKRRVHAA